MSSKSKPLIEQLAEVNPEIKQAIKTIELAPTSVTSDLLKITMYDTDEILVPLSELGKNCLTIVRLNPINSSKWYWYGSWDL